MKVGAISLPLQPVDCGEVHSVLVGRHWNDFDHSALNKLGKVLVQYYGLKMEATYIVLLTAALFGVLANLGMARKLGLGFALVLLLTLAVAAIGVAALYSVGQRFDSLRASS